jgi:hypothetical protein
MLHAFPTMSPLSKRISSNFTAHYCIHYYRCSSDLAFPENFFRQRLPLCEQFHSPQDAPYTTPHHTTPHHTEVLQNLDAIMFRKQSIHRHLLTNKTSLTLSSYVGLRHQPLQKCSNHIKIFLYIRKRVLTRNFTVISLESYLRESSLL